MAEQQSPLRYWAELGKTDPAHTKQFQRAGGFRGTAIKPIWMTQRMTETFGPCGIGWGMAEPQFQIVPAGDELMVFCTIALWYTDGDRTSEPVYGVGGDKIVMKSQSGSRTNDEAMKASYTDALSNAMKQIGVGADVHMGLFDDSKYVREAAQHFAEERQGEQAPAAKGPPQQSKGPPARTQTKGDETAARNDYARIKGELQQCRTPAECDTVMVSADAAIGNIKVCSVEGWNRLIAFANAERKRCEQAEQDSDDFPGADGIAA